MLGVGISASGVAVIKVKNDKESILAAVEQFNTGNLQKTIMCIKDTASDVLEGKLREIVSKLTVEEIYRDREKFASKVQEVAAIDLNDMGLEMKVLTIRDISDKNGYLEALGAEKIAQVKRKPISQRLKHKWNPILKLLRPFVVVRLQKSSHFHKLRKAIRIKNLEFRNIKAM